jgi:hypothetical protein
VASLLDVEAEAAAQAARRSCGSGANEAGVALIDVGVEAVVHAARRSCGSGADEAAASLLGGDARFWTPPPWATD